MHYLNEYSTFDNTEELNKAVYLHIRNNTHVLNETDRTALKMIARYAVKYAGAAHLKADTIANLIGKSEKTARRVVDKLCRLEIVEKIATTRKVNGGKGANIIVILPYNVQSITSSRGVDESPTDSKTQLRKNEIEPSDSIKRTKSTYLDTPSVPASALRSALPPAIYNAMSPFFNAEDLYRYYGLLLQAKRKICPDTLIEHDSEPYVEAFNAVILKVKQGAVRNIERYMYVAFEKAAAEVSRRAVTEENPRRKLLDYDWLSA